MDRLPQRYTQREITELKLHPRNPRKGNVESIRESIEHNGWYGAVLVQKSTGYIIAGNHRVQAAEAAGMKKIPIMEIDCDDTTAVRILLADNRTNDTATYDDEILADILKGLSEVDGSLLGTGYKLEDYDDIMAALQETQYSVDHNVTVRPTIDERLERYQEAMTRSIMLAYQLPEFGYIVEQLEAMRSKYETENNAMTILRMVEELTGTKAPA
jgi:ParB-like chromosome segregation protein Spo0J